jgi:hypothetical protein
MISFEIVRVELSDRKKMEDSVAENVWYFPFIVN